MLIGVCRKFFSGGEKVNVPQALNGVKKLEGKTFLPSKLENQGSVTSSPSTV